MQLSKLERALVPFGSERAVTPGTFESAQRQAAAGSRCCAAFCSA